MEEAIVLERGRDIVLAIYRLVTVHADGWVGLSASIMDAYIRTCLSPPGLSSWS